MRMSPLIALGASLLVLAACSKTDADGDKAGATATATAKAGVEPAEADGTVSINANSETGKVEIALPGGIEAKVKLPAGMPDGAKFDVDGVGLYPGAKITTVNVQADKKQGKGQATVTLGFDAPADAAPVADWYQQQFEAKSVAVNRKGDVLSGTTEDGDAFTLALQQGATGTARGTLVIIDAKD